MKMTIKSVFSDNRVTAAARAREEIYDGLIVRRDYWGEVDHDLTDKERAKIDAIIERRIDAIIRNNNLDRE
jgi:hypothetical protein